MEILQNFKPGSTAQVTATTTGVHVTFTSLQDINAQDVLISNEGTAWVYAASGNGPGTNAFAPTSTPSSGCSPVAPGNQILFNKGVGNDTVALITATGTSLVDVTAGVGN